MSIEPVSSVPLLPQTFAESPGARRGAARAALHPCHTCVTSLRIRSRRARPLGLHLAQLLAVGERPPSLPAAGVASAAAGSGSSSAVARGSCRPSEPIHSLAVRHVSAALLLASTSSAAADSPTPLVAARRIRSSRTSSRADPSPPRSLPAVLCARSCDGQRSEAVRQRAIPLDALRQAAVKAATAAVEAVVHEQGGVRTASSATSICA